MDWKRNSFDEPSCINSLMQRRLKWTPDISEAHGRSFEDNWNV
jgi:hypothetical protein